MKNSKDWWKHYDEGMQTVLFQEPAIFKPSDSRTRAEVKAILKAARLKKGSVILDLACGIGRHSRLLAKARHTVVGLDFSKTFLTQAEKLTPKNIRNRIKYIQGDMRKLRPHFENHTFDLVICVWNSFGYFDSRADDKKVIHEVSRVLKPGGKFILNTFNREGSKRLGYTLPVLSGLSEWQRWCFYRPNKLFLNRYGFNPKKSKSYGEFILVDLKTGKVKRYPHQDNLYTPNELKAMFKASGLDFKRIWAPLRGGRFTKRSFTQTLLASKKK